MSDQEQSMVETNAAFTAVNISPQNGTVDTPNASPKTPKKRKAVARKTEDGADGGDEDGSPTKKSKGQKAAGQRQGKGRSVGSSLAELSSEDKMLISMKEAGKPWSEINAMWEAATGQKPGRSTLGNRYIRIKANIEAVEPDDHQKLISAKKEVDEEIERDRKEMEEKFERERWARVAQKMEESGSKKYSTALLQKQYKKIADAAAIAATTSSAPATPTEADAADGTDPVTDGEA